MEHYRIERDIKSGNIKPVYLLMGEESYFIDELVKVFEEGILDETEKAFNLSVLYGRDVSIDQILSVSKGFPMMGERQVVIIKEAQDLKEWKKTSDLDPLISYLENPQLSTTLVFAHKNKSISKKLKIWKAFQKSATVFESASIRDYKIPEWIKNYLDSKSYSIDSQSCQILADYLGNDLNKLVNELNKLMIIIPKEIPITTKHIQDNIGISKDYNVFELQKAIGDKNIMKANLIINYFESNPKSNPIQMILPMLYNYFSRMLAFKTLKDTSNPAKSLSMSPWQAKELSRISQNFKVSKLEKIIGYIREADGKSKGLNNKSVSDAFLMKELVFKILHY